MSQTLTQLTQCFPFTGNKQHSLIWTKSMWLGSCAAFNDTGERIGVCLRRYRRSAVNAAGRAGSSVGSLPVSPPASHQTPGGSFPLTLLVSLPQTREELRAERTHSPSHTRTGQTIAPKAGVLYTRINAAFYFSLLCHFWIISTRALLIFFWIPNADRTLGLVSVGHPEPGLGCSDRRVFMCSPQPKGRAK